MHRSFLIVKYLTPLTSGQLRRKSHNRRSIYLTLTPHNALYTWKSLQEPSGDAAHAPQVQESMKQRKLATQEAPQSTQGSTPEEGEATRQGPPKEMKGTQQRMLVPSEALQPMPQHTSGESAELKLAQLKVPLYRADQADLDGAYSQRQPQQPHESVQPL